ncbi:hypothetical protein Tco_1449324 [Tanacetum coccineum]
MQKQTAGTLKSVQANGRVDYLADTAVWKEGNYNSMIVVWLFKRITTEDIGIDLNQGFDTFIEKKGNINSQHSPDSIELQSLNATSPLGAVTPMSLTKVVLRWSRISCVIVQPLNGLYSIAATHMGPVA